ncbi:MFS transporter [Zophobihabitans entericus]|uniref:MFS transporter n=1 Tax=Zophobihabitans entericus TaxID=1635327 RepID=A0A6G9I9Q2_9GAMM|nr:MFS transporter [Zophobihabitans entericus]QIQ20559.1 MFS transporter [Zophobihabitans entericus]
MEKKMYSKAWIVFFTGWFAGLSLACIQNKAAPAIPTLMTYFDINMGTAGLLVSIFSVTGIIMAFPGAALVQKFGIKKAMLTALFIACLGTTIGTFSSHIYLLMFSRILEGFGVGIMTIAGPALVIMLFPPNKRGLPMAIWAAFMMVGQAISFMVAAPLLSSFGWQGLWAFTLILSVLAGITFSMFGNLPPDESNFAISAVQKNQPVTIKKIDMFGGIKTLNSWLLGLAFMTFSFSSFGFVSWVAPYWSTFTGWSPATIGNAVSFIYLLEIAYAVIIGFILNKFLNHRLIGIVGFLIFTVLVYMCFTTTSVLVVMAFVIIYPFFDTLGACVCYAICPQTAEKPEHSEVALALMTLGINVGILLGPPISGAVIENFGWTAGALTLALGTVLAALCLFLIKLRRI